MLKQKYDAFIGTGNTGAVWLHLCLPLAELCPRPTIGSEFPLRKDDDCFDVGANDDCKPMHLLSSPDGLRLHYLHHIDKLRSDYCTW
jgi:fatty acid/phospholipid biosynthesis enzyme